MEGSGAFSQGDLGGDDDPFAGAEEDFGLSEQEREAAQRAADEQMEAENGGAVATEEPLPVVNREGEPVAADAAVEEQQPAADATQVAAEQSAAAVAEESDPFGEEAATTEDGSPAAAQGAGVDPTPASEQPSGTSADAPTEQESPEPASDAAGSSAAATEDPPAASTAGEPSAAAEEGGEPGGTEPGPSSASTEALGEAAGAASAGEETAGGDVAEPPKEKEGGTKRQYRLFTPEGNGKFAEVSWHEDKAGKVVPKGTTGAKKQTIVLARGQEDALRHGYLVLGQPSDGASLVAVAATYFQVKHVQPDEVQPVRQRLKIS